MKIPDNNIKKLFNLTCLAFDIFCTIAWASNVDYSGIRNNSIN
jgi:hypothetical protein